VTAGVIHGVIVVQAGVGELDWPAQLFGGAQDFFELLAISALPAIDGRKLITSTYGTVPPGVATTISWPARLSAS
jgi:hypothetical protein